jgi:hypothetical protein
MALHELDQGADGNAAILGTGNAIASQLARWPESNHLLTVRDATLQIFATSPVVSTSFSNGFMPDLTIKEAGQPEPRSSDPLLLDRFDLNPN